MIPGGVGSAIQFKPPYPLYIGDSKGSRVWDLDGNEYIDYSLCYAAMVAGHANPIIVQAIKEQAEHGTLFGMPTTLAGDLAEEIIRRYAGVIDMVRFTQSGVEATQTAKNGLKVLQLTSPDSQPGFYGFSPAPRPELIAWRDIGTPSLARLLSHPRPCSAARRPSRPLIMKYNLPPRATLRSPPRAHGQTRISSRRR